MKRLLLRLLRLTNKIHVVNLKLIIISTLRKNR